MQCMQATEIDFSPGLAVLQGDHVPPVDTPGDVVRVLAAVTQPLHSMQRSASQRNFILAIGILLLSHAGVMRQSVALVSCIWVTES